MDVTWQSITQIMGVGVPIRAQQILAQTTPPLAIDPARPGEAVEPGVDYVQGLVVPVAIAALNALRSRDD